MMGSRYLKRLRRANEGATAVEFALIAMPLSVLLLGGLDLGHQVWTRSQLQGALLDSARRAAVEDPAFTASGSNLEERIRNTVKAQVDPIAPNGSYTITISNFYEFSGIGNPEKIVTDKNGNGEYDDSDGDCFEDLNDNGSYDLDAGRSGVGGANDVVFYEATVEVPRLLPMTSLLGWSDKMSLSASAAIRNQPYANQAQPAVICGS